MNAYRIETTLGHNGTLTLNNLPFFQGKMVEVIILSRPANMPDVNAYPLRGMPILEYANPFEPVAQDDWEVNQAIMLNNPCLSTPKDAAITHGTHQ